MVFEVMGVYFAGITAMTFLVFGLDKARAARGKVGVRRVPESMLWLLMVCGGSIGALVGMNYFRHKTKKLSFQAGAAVILTMQVVGLLVLFG